MKGSGKVVSDTPCYCIYYMYPATLHMPTNLLLTNHLSALQDSQDGYGVYTYQNDDEDIDTYEGEIRVSVTL